MSGIQAVHDVTIAYPYNIPISEADLLRGEIPKEVHFHIKRHSIDEVSFVFLYELSFTRFPLTVVLRYRLHMSLFCFEHNIVFVLSIHSNVILSLRFQVLYY